MEVAHGKAKNQLHERLQNVKYQIESGLSIAQVARENGLHPSLVARWKREYLDRMEDDDIDDYEE